MRLRSLVTTSLVLTVVAGSLAPALAADRWDLLGSRRVTDRVDHDEIVITAKEGTFTALQLRVKGVAVQFRSMTIHFANDEKQEVELKNVIPAGGQSRVIDVVGAERIIRRVSFVYDSQSVRGRRAYVRLYGRH